MGSVFDGYEVYQEISTVIKIYPDFIRLIRYREPVLIRRFDYDEQRLNGEKKSKTKIEDDEENDLDGIRLARTRLIDITLCNEFDLFVTFTFAKDRYDVDLLKRRMAFWLNNQRILHGKFLYVIVPEYHKDKALHFHALFCGYNGNLVDSGKRYKNRILYNISSYRAGYTRAEYIESRTKTAGYVAKYITKDMPRLKNKQRYWCSNGLKRPLKIVNPLLNEKDKSLFERVFNDKQKEILEFRGQFSDNDLARIAAYGTRRDDDLRIFGRE